MKAHVAGAGAIALVVLVAGCSSGFNRPVREVTATVGADHVQHVRVTTHSFWFEPNRIVVRKDVPVELTVKNGAFLVPHSFTCMGKDAGVDVDAMNGMFLGSRHVRFTPTRAGEYPFHCDVDGHMKKGMVGVLVVVDR